MSRKGRQPPAMTPERAQEILRRAGRISEAPNPVSDGFVFADGVKLPPRQMICLRAILQGATYAEAAEASQLEYLYVRQLMVKGTDFHKACQEAMRILHESALREGQFIVNLAVRRQRDLLTDPSTPHAVVAQVARDILDRFGVQKTEEIAAASATVTDADAARAISAAASLPDLPEGSEG